MKAALALALASGCALDMTAPLPWVPAESIGAPLTIEAQTNSGLAKRAVPTNPLRVVTYNVQYGPDPHGAAQALLDSPELASAGVVLVQEIESYPEEGASRASTMAADLGMGYVYVPARVKDTGTHGLAILSMFPIGDVQKMDLPDSAHMVQHRIAIQVTLDVAGTPLSLIDVHLDTELDTAQRIAQLSPVVRGAPDTTLIGGDFNMSSVQWVGGSVPVLSASGATDQAPVIDGYMAQQGFATPCADSGPTEHMFGYEQRLDAIYPRGLEATFGGVPKVGPSDHWPMWVDVALP